MNESQLNEITGGGDPAGQPLNMPPGLASPSGLLPAWVRTVADYLKYLGLSSAL